MRPFKNPGLSHNPLFAFLDQQGPLLTREEEAARGKAAHAGCRRSRNELVEHNMRLVIDLVSRSGCCDEQDLLDRIKEGARGMIRAAEKFDSAAGCRFSTYARWWVRQAISRERDGNLPMRVQLALVREMRATEHVLLDRLGREPTIEELAAEIGMQASEVAAARAALRPRSLDVPVEEDGDGTLAGLIVDDASPDPVAAAERADLRAQIAMHLSRLTRKECAVVRLRYGLETGTPETLTQVCKIMGLGLDEARRIEARAICRLQENAAEPPPADAATAITPEVELPARLRDSIRARGLLSGTGPVARSNRWTGVGAAMLQEASHGC